MVEPGLRCAGERDVSCWAAKSESHLDLRGIEEPAGARTRMSRIVVYELRARAERKETSQVVQYFVRVSLETTTSPQVNQFAGASFSKQSEKPSSTKREEPHSKGRLEHDARRRRF